MVFSWPVFADRTAAFPYRLRVENHEGHSWEFVDPYLFGPVLTDFDLHLLGEGTHYRNYERLGAHLRTHRGFRGVHFAVWAPERAAGQRHRQLQSLGRPAASHGQPRRDGDLGDLHPRPLPGRSLQVRGQEPARRLSRPEVRPLRLRRGAAAQDGLGRLGRHPVLLERPGMDRRPSRAAGSRPADRRLRGSPRLVETRRRARQSRSSTTASWPTSSSLTSTTPTSRTSS